ncbi:DMT family transporter [Rhodovulum iodosum]|nr:DMT family transporter [Rhodovulum robiginosum]
MAGGGSARRGIVYILLGMLFISVNDMLIKLLSDRYPLHQMVFARSMIGLVVLLGIVQAEGAWRRLWPARPWLQLLRAVLIVIANMTFFAALAVMALATATALFFVAPLAITALSALLLGERVGPRRWAAVAVGFLGVLVMLRPWAGWDGMAPSRWSLLLPVAAALCYAGMQVLTRKLGATAPASALALYIQVTFLAVGAVFFVVAGDGRFAEGVESESLVFLLKPWVMPPADELWLFGLLGLVSAGVGYCLSQAYRLGDAATIAPFEYVTLPLAIFWGWALFGEVPGVWVLAGAALIAGAGLYVFARERRVGRGADFPREGA